MEPQTWCLIYSRPYPLVRLVHTCGQPHPCPWSGAACPHIQVSPMPMGSSRSPFLWSGAARAHGQVLTVPLLEFCPCPWVAPGAYAHDGQCQVLGIGQDLPIAHCSLSIGTGHPSLSHARALCVHFPLGPCRAIGVYRSSGKTLVS